MRPIYLDSPARGSAAWTWAVLIVVLATSVVSIGLHVWTLSTQPVAADNVFREAQTCVCRDVTPARKR